MHHLTSLYLSVFPFEMKELDKFTSKSHLPIKFYDLKKTRGLFSCPQCMKNQQAVSS